MEGLVERENYDSYCNYHEMRVACDLVKIIPDNKDMLVVIRACECGCFNIDIDEDRETIERIREDILKNLGKEVICESFSREWFRAKLSKALIRYLELYQTIKELEKIKEQLWEDEGIEERTTPIHMEDYMGRGMEYYMGDKVGV